MPQLSALEQRIDKNWAMKLKADTAEVRCVAAKLTDAWP